MARTTDLVQCGCQRAELPVLKWGCSPPQLAAITSLAQRETLRCRSSCGYMLRQLFQRIGFDHGAYAAHFGKAKRVIRIRRRYPCSSSIVLPPLICTCVRTTRVGRLWVISALSPASSLIARKRRCAIPYGAVRHDHGGNHTSPTCLHRSGAAVWIPDTITTGRSPRFTMACMHGPTELLDEIAEYGNLVQDSRPTNDGKFLI